jgi:hypothetical protein
MSEPIHDKLGNDDPLIQRLKDAAAADMPRFSAELHEKIMRRIESASIEPAPRRMNWRPLLSLAATVMVCAGASLYWLSHRPGPGLRPDDRQARAVPSMPTITNPVAAMDQTVATNWPGNRYAALDQDGRQFFSFLSRELDVAPQVRR